MAKRKRHPQANRGEMPASGSPSALRRRRWGVVIGILAVAVAMAVAIDWWRSDWSAEGEALEPMAGSNSADLATGVGRAAGPPPQLSELLVEDLVAAANSHETLTAAMTRVATGVVTAFPDDPTAYDLQGRICAYLGKTNEAARAWERCLELDARRPDACNGLAKLAIKRGDDAGAEPLLRRALELHPGFDEVVQQLADLLTRTGRARDAITLLEQYVQQFPKAAEQTLTLAQTQLQVGDLDGARANFETVVRLLPTSSEAYLGLGNCLTRLGQRDEARKYLETSRELRASKPARPPDLTAEAFDMLQSRVNCASSILYAARIYHSHGSREIAAQLGHQAIALDPKSLSGRLFLISLYQEMDRLPDAIEVCEATLAVDPQNPDLLWQLGALNAQAGHWLAAEKLLKQVVQLAPQQARGYAGLAEVYLRTQLDGTEALRLAQEAVRLEPAAGNYALLGRCYALTGDRQQARAAVDEAIRREPDNRLWHELRDELETQR